MLATKPYNRARAVEYAQKWALSRNPLFADFTGRGGNCTNFISQAVLAGSCTMNYTPDFGWHYISIENRAPVRSGAFEPGRGCKPDAGIPSHRHHAVKYSASKGG